MGKNILRQQFGEMIRKSKPNQPLQREVETLTSIQLPVLPVKQPSVSMSVAILFILFLILVVFLYLNRARLYSIVLKLYHDLDFSNGKIDSIEQKYHDMTQPQKQDPILKDILQTDKSILDTLEKQEKEKIQQEKIQESGGVRQIQEKINRYSQEQQVKGDGFCYIGYDKNQRECTNVYEGDICMSGQIFPTMAVCLNPHLRP